LAIHTDHVPVTAGRCHLRPPVGVFRPGAARTRARRAAAKPQDSEDDPPPGWDGTSDAADVGQTVWLQFLDHLGQIRDPDTLAGWLTTTTRRECGRIRRSVRGPRAAGDGLDPDTMLDEQTRTRSRSCRRPSGTLRCARRSRACRPAARPCSSCSLKTLPCPYTQISAKLDIPVGSIGPARRRCLDKLRRDPAIAALMNAAVDIATAGKLPWQPAAQQ
jgi:DNA-directed RNA polymerase specialized sigma24 family protein